MTPAYIAIGSNLNQPQTQAQSALHALARLPESQLQAVSRFYRTPPLGDPGQPDYLNAAVCLATRLSARQLLAHLQAIELQQGRQRQAERWSPRTLDLDIMLFGRQTFAQSDLTIPHYDLLNRAFMLLPLLDIAPGLHLPDGTDLAQALARLDCSGIHPW